MGDIADDIIDGIFCEQCGEYIDGEAPGYPRKCGGCGISSMRATKTGRIKSVDKSNVPQIKGPTVGKNAVKGVRNYLSSKILIEDISEILTTFAKEKMDDENLDEESICEYIQRDFGAFVKWYKSKLKK